MHIRCRTALPCALDKSRFHHAATHAYAHRQQRSKSQRVQYTMYVTIYTSVIVSVRQNYQVLQNYLMPAQVHTPETQRPTSCVKHKWTNKSGLDRSLCRFVLRATRRENSSKCMTMHALSVCDVYEI